MKIKKKLLMGILIGSILTGCSDKVSIESMKPPTLETAYEKLNTYIASNMDKLEILDFQYGENRDNALLYDLDSDGDKEGLVFYKDNDDRENIHVNVLNLDGDKYKKSLDIVFPGEALTKVEFHDMDLDGNIELALGYRGSISDGFNYYEYQDNDVNLLQRSMFTDWFFGDIDNDGRQELYAFDRGDRYQSDDGEWLDKDFDDIDTRIEMYRLNENQLNLADRCNIEEFTNGVIWWKQGRISKDKRGIFLGNGIGNASYTSLILLDENGKMYDFYYNPESKINEETFGKFSLSARDIDNDGILEFAITDVSKGDEDVSMSEIIWIDKWYKWSKDNKKMYVSSSHYSYYFKTLYHIPEEIVENLKIDGFGSENEEIYLDYSFKDDVNEEKLFSIYSPTFTKKDEIISSGGKELELKGRVFILKVYENNYGLTYDSILENLEIVIE